MNEVQLLSITGLHKLYLTDQDAYAPVASCRLSDTARMALRYRGYYKDAAGQLLSLCCLITDAPEND